MVGIHAERVDGDDRAVRWVVPPGLVPVGRVRSAPGRLGEMLRDGTLSDALTEHGAVWLWVPQCRSWSGVGAQVQSALQHALTQPDGWVVEPAPGEVLEYVTADLLAGSAGDFVRSHGGNVTAERHGDEVAVRLGGACEHCAAAEFTLRLRLLDALRKRCPELEESVGRGVLTVKLSGVATTGP